MYSAVIDLKSLCKMFCIAQNFIESDLEEIVPYLEINILLKGYFSFFSISFAPKFLFSILHT